MAVDNNAPKAGAHNLLLCKCPRCRKGDMFEEKNPYNLKRFMKMHKLCPVCGQELDIEVGFYYGSSYVSYALTIAFSVATLTAWWVIIGVSLYDNRIFYWLTINSLLMLALQPVFMRLARTLWLAFFVRYDRNWQLHPPKKSERVNEQLMDAW
jgi:uncharacterized protein (DUF983 family)